MQQELKVQCDDLEMYTRNPKAITTIIKQRILAKKDNNKDKLES